MTRNRQTSDHLLAHLQMIMQPVATGWYPNSKVLDVCCAVVAETIDTVEEATDGKHFFRVVGSEVKGERDDIQHDAVNTCTKRLPLVVPQSGHSIQALHGLVSRVGEITTNVERIIPMVHRHDLAVQPALWKR
jgi:hypothetical protein